MPTEPPTYLFQILLSETLGIGISLAIPGGIVSMFDTDTKTLNSDTDTSKFKMIIKYSLILTKYSIFWDFLNNFFNILKGFAACHLCQLITNIILFQT